MKVAFCTELRGLQPQDQPIPTASARQLADQLDLTNPRKGDATLRRAPRRRKTATGMR
jgi:hypothetical protein